MMSWGTELWDQTDNISTHVQKGIDFCEKFAHFLKEKCILENEYAAKLKRLVKNYQPKRKDEDCEYTCIKGFQEMISEMHDMAGQHEVIAESITSKTLKDLHLLIQEVKNDRKKYMQENAKQNSCMQAQWLQLDKIKKQYEKTFRESEKARELYHKADADINLSRAEVEKARNFMIQKQQTCDSAKADYASELKKTNDCQKEHFYRLIPAISQHLQDLEESRVKSMQAFYQECGETEKKVVPIISTCIEGMAKAASVVSATADIRVVIEKYKTGFIPPGDIAFEDLSAEGSNSAEGLSHSTSVQSLTRVDVAKTTKPIAVAKNKKMTKILGIFVSSKQNEEPKEDFSHLPPSQQKKKLKQQIASIKASIAKETAEKDGLLKMQDVYQKNHSLGDPLSIAKQLEENTQKLDQLYAEMQKFQMYLADADADSQPQSKQNLPAVKHLSITNTEDQPPNMRSDDQRESFHGSEVSLELTVNDKVKSLLSGESSDSFEGPDDVISGSAVLAVGEVCKAVYPFTAQNEASLSMEAGEQFTILELDQGDGWLRVKNSLGVEGFVPRGYME